MLFCLVSPYSSLLSHLSSVFFLMLRRPPRSTRTVTLFPSTTLFRSFSCALVTAALCRGCGVLSQRKRPPCSLGRNSHSRLETLCPVGSIRSEEHTSELQSLMRISYAVFCLKKKTKYYNT